MQLEHRTNCRICGSESITEILDLGMIPLANNYRDTASTGKEERYPLRLYRCTDCGLVQLRDIVPGDMLFQDYDYVTGETSESLPPYFESYADQVMGQFPDSRPFVVEIGSNDGTFLTAVKQRGGTVLGVDPAENLADVAGERGVKTWPRFFSSAVADEIVAERGQADVVVANNVLGHVDDLHDVMDGITRVLSDDGRLFIEVQYLPDLLDQNAFDMVYHEHRSYFSVAPLQQLLQEHGIRITSIQRTSAQGGSIRVQAVQGSTGTEDIQKWIGREKEQGVYNEDRYQQFRESVERLKHKLRHMVTDLVEEGQTLAGYGAPAKAAVLLNYCGIGDRVSFAIDEISAKQGKYLPGTAIPIRSPEAFHADTVDYGLLLAWNFEQEILEKEQAFLKNGGRFIHPFPAPQIRF